MRFCSQFSVDSMCHFLVTIDNKAVWQNSFNEQFNILFKIGLAFYKSMDYTDTSKYEQWLWSRNDASQALELNKGMGRKPRIDQYRVCLGSCPLVKASHWESLLRRQGRNLLRHEPGDLL